MISTHSPILLPILLEAALRALLVGITVWSGLRLLRVGNVPAQKTAWGLVLVAALAIPILTPLMQRLPGFAAVRLPALSLPGVFRTAPSQTHTADAQSQPAATAISASEPAAMDDAMPARRELAPAPARSSAHDIPTHTRSSPPADFTFPPQRQFMPQVSPVPDRAAAAEASTLRLPSLANFAWLVYLTVCSALLLRLVFGLVATARLWRMATPVEVDTAFPEPIGMLVRSSRRVSSPVTLGSGVVLPADYAEWDAEKLRIVLAHERSHIRQRDFYLQLLAGFYAAVFWFSPLGWWLKRKLSELAEAISDRAGLEEAASRSSYAQILLEFAALPRPTLIGVAMACKSNLPQRIERLLNDSNFRQAFAGGRRRALPAVLLVPVALFAATALVRVEAATPADAGQARPEIPPVPAAAPTQQATIPGHSNPDQPNDPTPPAAKFSVVSPAPPVASAEPPAPAPAPTPAPAPRPAAAVVVIPGMAALSAPWVQVVSPAPPAPPVQDKQGEQDGQGVGSGAGRGRAAGHSYGYVDGDSYAIVGDPGTKTRYSGDWDGSRSALIERARQTAHGHFLLFQHDGKSYIVDDPSIVAQIEAMNKPMEELGEKMRDFGKQQREIGEQQREQNRKAREAAANIPAPDLTKEMAALNAAVASLQANQGGTVSREQLAEIQRKVSEVQRELIKAQVNAQVKVNVDFGRDMAKFGEEQGKFGAEMGRMGAEMGRMARENEDKIQGIIKDSLSNGEAKPVE